LSANVADAADALSASPGCPKCGQLRSADATVPAWQCPGCGVAYHKVAGPAAGVRQLALQRRARDARHARRAGHATLDSLREDPVEWMIASYAVLLTFAALFTIWLPVPAVPRVAFLAMAALSLYFWIRAYRVQRAVRDAPTSRIASAAQGYVELQGTAHPLRGEELVSPYSHTACVWYGCRQYSRGRRADVSAKSHAHSEESHAPFLLRDETGECLVLPAQARIIAGRGKTLTTRDITTIEWTIPIGTPLYAIGWFSSKHAPIRHVDEVTARVKDWLADPRAFFARFDADRDGRISDAELRAARAAARRESEAKYVAQGGAHRLSKPKDGRLMILSDLGHDELARELAARPWIHIVLFFAALGFFGNSLAG
jgi:ribosomal protein L37AE/L43A